MVAWHKDLEKRGAPITTENQDQELAALWQIYTTIFVTILMKFNENFPLASKFNSECIIPIFKATIKTKAPALLKVAFPTNVWSS